MLIIARQWILRILILFISLNWVLSGCNSNSILNPTAKYWYKTGATGNECHHDLRDYGDQGMSGLGYGLFKVEDLPPNVKNYKLISSDRYGIAYDENSYDKKREHYIKEHPELEDNIKKAILNKEIVSGMSPDDVRISWIESGASLIKQYKASDGTEIYRFGSYTLTFQNKRLVRWAMYNL